MKLLLDFVLFFVSYLEVQFVITFVLIDKKMES